jgi:hypothetical protein
MRKRWSRLSVVGRVAVAVTVAVVIALVFTRALAVLILAVVVAMFWGSVAISSSSPTWRKNMLGEDPGSSPEERWRDANL